MKKMIFFTLLSAIAPLCLHAQDEAEEQAQPVKRVVRNVSSVPTHPVSGRVIDAATGQPAVGISVKAYGTNLYAAMTDENGEYTIKVPDWVTSLTFNAEGYALVQQAIGKGDKVIPVKMYSDKFTDIYSTSTSAKTSHTALVSYNTNDLSIDNQIQSQLGGDMRTVTRSGVAGTGVTMLMNGINSLNANAQPLIILDGVIQNMQYGATSLHDGFFNNVLANIMVEDIEKISVLKNGTAIYGAKGANGVVIIETKRNKSMATKIDLSIGGSYEMLPSLPSMMNSEQFRVYASELIGTTGTKSNSFKFLQTDPNYYYYHQYHNSTDWTKEVYKEAYTQNYSINVQGGDDVANYNLSVGFANGDATLINNSFSRFNLRLNSDIILAKNLNVRFDASYSDVTRNMRDDAVKDNVTDGVISSPAFLSLIKSPFLSPYAYDALGNRSDYLADADDYLSDVVSRKGITTSLANPKSILENGEAKNKNDFGNRTVSLSVTPKWDINRDWSIADHFAFHLNNTDANYYLPTKGVPTYEVEGLGKEENMACALAGRQVTFWNDLYGQYKHRFQAHYVNVRGGFRYIHDTFRQNILGGYDTGNDKTPNISANLNDKYIVGVDNNDIDLTYYLTGDYNYRERYYLSAGVSMDGSSKFGVDANDGIKIGNYAFGFFPSVQAAWVLTNEDWFRPSKGLNYLKLNVGFDISGNDDISTRASRTYFVAGKMFQSVAGKTLGNIGNTNLQWETTSRLTAGIQLATFNNRLQVGFNYFNSTTDNLLCLSKLSYLTGTRTNWSNDGKLANEGFDVSLNARLLNTRDWTWSVAASAGHYKNEIKKLPRGAESMTENLYGATIISKVGSAAGLFYGYKTNGVFATSEEASAAGLYQETRTGTKQYFSAGDMRFEDVDGNHVINEKDMQVIGDPNPDIYGNFSTQVTYKRFALDVNFNYSLGNDLYNYQRSILEGGSFFYNQTTAVLNRWNHEGQITSIPRASFLDEMGNSRFSDRWIEDGSYLKLKTVTLSYHIPVRSTYLQGLTFWASANNLFTLTKYLGSDPEFAQSNSVLGIGIDRGTLAPGKSFNLGVKINL